MTHPQRQDLFPFVKIIVRNILYPLLEKNSFSGSDTILFCKEWLQFILASKKKKEQRKKRATSLKNKAKREKKRVKPHQTKK